MYMYMNIHIHVHIKSWVPVAHEVPTAIFCCCYVWGHHVHVQLVNIRVLNYSKTHVHVYSTCTCTYTHMCNGAHKFLHLPLSISCLYGMYSIIPYTSFPVSLPHPSPSHVRNVVARAKQFTWSGCHPCSFMYKYLAYVRVHMVGHGQWHDMYTVRVNVLHVYLLPCPPEGLHI